jgi:transmembrane 9 superfamily protein 2/4
MAGILPFGACFIELFFIFSAIWENQYYYLFGFLFLVFIIVIISCSEIAVVMTYFQLCAEDYHWWWRSFVASGGCAIYVFFYSVFYYATEVNEFIYYKFFLKDISKVVKFFNKKILYRCLILIKFFTKYFKN